MQTLVVLNLGNDEDLATVFTWIIQKELVIRLEVYNEAWNTKNVADFVDSGSITDERSEDDVDSLLDAEADVSRVFLGDSRQIDIGAGQVDALLASEKTTVLDLADKEVLTCNIEASVKHHKQPTIQESYRSP